MYFCSFGLSITCSLEKNGIDLFRKIETRLLQIYYTFQFKNILDSQKPNLHFHGFPDTKVNTSNLWHVYLISLVLQIEHPHINHLKPEFFVHLMQI